MDKGTLYLVATPIGNLGDITYRAVETLKAVDLIAAEDTRHTRQLLNHLEIQKPLISYFQHNMFVKGPFLIDKLLAGVNIALVCDAGTPGVSDPGSDLVKLARANDLAVVAIPGASAILTGLTASGLATDRFTFEGFLPRDKAGRRSCLNNLSNEERTMVFYESPHRLLATLKDMEVAFGSKRVLVVARELTKFHEEFIKGSVSDVIKIFTEKAPLGEFCLIIQGAEPLVPTEIDEAILAEELASLLAAGKGRKESAKLLAEKYQLSVKKIYNLNLR